VVFWIFVVVFVGAYIATFAADRVVDRLAQNKGSLSIESVDDLAAQNEIQYGFLRGGSTSEYFRVSLSLKELPRSDSDPWTHFNAALYLISPIRFLVQHTKVPLYRKINGMISRLNKDGAHTLTRTLEQGVQKVRDSSGMKA
jgi:hypothetical protein